MNSGLCCDPAERYRVCNRYSAIDCTVNLLFIKDGPYDRQPVIVLYLHLVRKYVRPNRSCSFCQL